MNRKLWTSTLHNLYKNQCLFLKWKFFWLTVETKIDQTNKLNFSDRLSLYQGKLSTGAFFSDNLYHYEGKKFHLSNFIRQRVALSGELGPLEKSSQESSVIPLITFFFETASFQDGREWLTALAVFFMISLAFHGWFFLFLEFCSNEKNLLVKLDTNFSPFFHLHWYSQVDSIVTFISEYSVTLNWNGVLKCFRSVETTKLRVRIVTRINLAGHKKSCSVGLPNGSKCLNIFTKSQSDLKYHIAVQHSVPKPVVMFEFEFRYQKFQEFYALRQH